MLDVCDCMVMHVHLKGPSALPDNVHVYNQNLVHIPVNLMLMYIHVVSLTCYTLYNRVIFMHIHVHVCVHV